jgi:hypothetical protein
MRENHAEERLISLATSSCLPGTIARTSCVANDSALFDGLHDVCVALRVSDHPSLLLEATGGWGETRVHRGPLLFQGSDLVEGIASHRSDGALVTAGAAPCGA